MEHLKLEDYLSKLCKDSFAGYAVTQIKKARGLKKKIMNPMEKEKQSLLDFCFILEGYDSITLKSWFQNNNFKQEHCGLTNIPNSKGVYAVFYNEKAKYKGIIQKENANEVSLSSIEKGEKEIAYLYCNQDSYSSYCKDYKEYWDWIEKRNDDRYKTNQQHGKNYDSKNMMHTIRLLQTAEQILKTGQLNIRVANRDELLGIKSGKIEYDDLLKMADDLIASIENLYPNCSLQESPNSQKTASILVEMRTELYP